jgi:hypothetical protein
MRLSPFLAALAVAATPVSAFDVATIAGAAADTAAQVEAFARPAEAQPVSFHFAAREEGHELQVTDVHVTIDDAATLGRVLSVVSDGPFLQATVPAGAYQVTATHGGRAQVAVIHVGGPEPTRVAFYW